MPLNPNGKIDKPALPFPDTALQAPVSASAKSQKLTPTQKTIHDVWMSLLPAPPGAIELDENFFDLGGHSILATRATFELRKAFVVDVPLGLVFDQPTISGSQVMPLISPRDIKVLLSTPTMPRMWMCCCPACPKSSPSYLPIMLPRRSPSS
jgi:hypothetical protein